MEINKRDMVVGVIVSILRGVGLLCFLNFLNVTSPAGIVFVALIWTQATEPIIKKIIVPFWIWLEAKGEKHGSR